MIPEFTISNSLEEISNIWNETIQKQNHPIVYARFILKKAAILKQAFIQKEQGVSPEALVSDVLRYRLAGETTIQHAIETKKYVNASSCKKDAFYRLLKHPNAQWDQLLYLFTHALLKGHHDSYKQ